MEAKLFADAMADAGRGFSQTPLIDRWSHSGSHPFDDEPSELDLEDDILSGVDSSTELGSFELDQISGPSSGRQSAVPMFTLATSASPLPDATASATGDFPLLDGGGEIDTNLISTLMHSSELQQPVNLQQLLQQLDSLEKLDPQDTQLSADYIAKILMPTAFDQQPVTPTIMTPAMHGPISSVAVSAPEITPALQGNMLQPPSLVLVNGIPSPDSLPPTPYFPPHSLPPLSSILPSDCQHEIFPLLSPQQTASVPSGKYRKPLEKKRRRSESSCSSYNCNEDRPAVKKSKGGGRAGQLKFKKTDNQLVVLRTYFSINKMPPREAIQKLGEITGLTFQEVRNWFRNARLRYKDPVQPTADLSLFRGIPGIPEHFFKRECNSEPTKSSHNKAHIAAHQFAPKKLRVQSNATSSTNNVAVEGARRSERIRTGWRSAATMAALLEAEKYHMSKNSAVHTCVDQYSCDSSWQAARHGCRAQSGVPTSTVVKTEQEPPLPFAIFQGRESQHHDATDGDILLTSRAVPCSAISPAQLTPPTTPSTTSFFMDDNHIPMSSAKLANHKEISAARQQIPQETFEVVRDRFVKSFTHQPPDSKARKELLKALVRELDVKEKASVHVMVSAKVNRSLPDSYLYQIDMKDRAKDAWEELQDLFKTTSTLNGMNEVVAGCQSYCRFDGNTPDASFMVPDAIDEDMFEGLKGMFQFHRDYLHAVWKGHNSASGGIRQSCGRKCSISTDSDDSMEGKVSDLEEH